MNEEQQFLLQHTALVSDDNIVSTRMTLNEPNVVHAHSGLD